ncbi:phosphatase modulator [Lithospermum erythrorhizon]|uniref:Phosphatase modulator n=1 Tax=Lithospermum erythrorhizon TaxID=34254 RepID=A0AAV3PR91_LITER
MFWKLPSFSSASPIESVLDKENFTLEELLDEEEIIQECRALNGRLINFLRERDQIEQLLRYIVEVAPEDVDNKRTFKFPFVACEIITSEIDVILKTLVEEEELMDLLFSFLEPNRSHCALLAGYFSKVVICLMLRKTVPLMTYVQGHQDVLLRLVDLIGITSILEVLVRLVGADDYFYPNSMDVMQWLADSHLLEMIVDKLNHSSPAEVHANAAETLCAITRTAPSPLATKLSSPSFVSRVFSHALEDAHSKSGLVHSLSLCIALLDPRRSMPTTRMYSFRSQQLNESPIHVNPDTLGAMLPKLGDLLKLLNVSADEKVLHTTYGELRPPLGKHRLKIVEFIAVLLKTGNDVAEKELISSGTVHRVLDLFFEYPFNNALHHQVESMIYSCLESKNNLIDHLFNDCGLVGKIIQADNHPTLSGDTNQPTKPSSAAKAPKVGYLGHLTRISNKLVQLANKDKRILAHLQENEEWNEWRANVLQERNLVENVCRWGCGRPTALHDRTRDGDEVDANDRDYDVAALANNLSQAFGYSTYDNNDAEEGQGTLDRDDEDVYFDDESAEVVISSLRLGDDQGSSLFTNSNWFAFQEDSTGDGMSTSFPTDVMEEINLNGTTNGDNINKDDEVVVAEDKELAQNKDSAIWSSTIIENVVNGVGGTGEGQLSQIEKTGTSGNDVGIFQFETPDNDDDLFGDGPIPEWVAWGEAPDLPVNAASTNPFLDQNIFNIHSDSSDKAASMPPSDALGGESVPTSTSDSGESSVASDCSPKTASLPSLFEEDVEFVGVEVEGTEKAMEQALKEGIVGEAGPMRRNIPKETEMENQDDSGQGGIQEFNDKNYWKVEQEVTILE